LFILVSDELKRFESQEPLLQTLKKENQALKSKQQNNAILNERVAELEVPAILVLAMATSLRSFSNSEGKSRSSK